jgi:hypothetical protein
MDLSSLDSTLPPALADAERDMGDKFRGMSCSGSNQISRCLYRSDWNVNNEVEREVRIWMHTTIGPSTD